MKTYLIPIIVSAAILASYFVLQPSLPERPLSKQCDIPDDVNFIEQRAISAPNDGKPHYSIQKEFSIFHTVPIGQFNIDEDAHSLILKPVYASHGYIVMCDPLPVLEKRFNVNLNGMLVLVDDKEITPNITNNVLKIDVDNDTRIEIMGFWEPGPTDGFTPTAIPSHQYQEANERDEYQNAKLSGTISVPAEPSQRTIKELDATMDDLLQSGFPLASIAIDYELGVLVLWTPDLTIGDKIKEKLGDVPFVLLYEEAPPRWEHGGPEPSSNAIETVNVDILSGSANPLQEENISPKTIHVVIGINNTVQWNNLDDTPHTLTPDLQYDGFSSIGMIYPGNSFEMTFEKLGTFGYHGTPGPWIKGTVIVTGD